MSLPRIIPVLLLHDHGLVKTIKFKKPVYLGDPVNTVKLFNDLEVDELIFLDIDASRTGRNPDYGYLKEVVSEAFMPVAYGGGVKDLKEIQTLVQTGIEKVVINHAARNSPGFIKEAAASFGSSTIIAAMDIKKNLFGQSRVYDHVGRTTLTDDPVAYALRIQDLGAGELFINDVDLDGTMKGYNLSLFAAISEAVSIPVIACGGCGTTTDLRKVITEARVSAAAAGSLFVFHGPHRAVLITYPSRKDMKALLE